MNPSQSSIALLALLILVISMWWISRTLKEGIKAVKEMNQEKLKDEKAETKPIQSNIKSR